MAITEARKRLNRKFTWLVREGITKCLRKHGLNQKGRYYWRDCDTTVAFAIYVGKLPQWDPDACTFSIYCGMVAHVVPLIYEKLAPNWVPDAMVGQITARPAELTPTVGPHFVIKSAASDDDLAAMAESITRLLEDVVLPWYSKFKTARDVGDYLTSHGERPGKIWFGYREIKHHPESLRQAAIAYFGAGDHERALAMLDLAAKTNDRPGLDHTHDLRKRLTRLIANGKAAH
jgi:hypothetical protein